MFSPPKHIVHPAAEALRAIPCATLNEGRIWQAERLREKTGRIVSPKAKEKPEFFDLKC